MDRTKASFFRNLALLAGAGKPALDPLVSAAARVDLPRHACLFQPGDQADSVYWVASGCLKTTLPLGKGKQLTLHFHGKGHILGEGAVLSAGRPHQSSAVAHDPTAVWVAPAEVAEPVLALPEIALRLAQLVDERRRRLEHRLALHQHDAIARVAGVILELSEEGGVRDSRGVILGIKLTHKDLAGLVGSSRETVSLALVDLRRERLVLVEERRIVLLDPDGLRALADPGRSE
jgi:CRP-like cAMP-binding protein